MLAYLDDLRRQEVPVLQAAYCSAEMARAPKIPPLLSTAFQDLRVSDMSGETPFHGALSGAFMVNCATGRRPALLLDADSPAAKLVVCGVATGPEVVAAALLGETAFEPPGLALARAVRSRAYRASLQPPFDVPSLVALDCHRLALLRASLPVGSSEIRQLGRLAAQQKRAMCGCPAAAAAPEAAPTATAMGAPSNVSLHVYLLDSVAVERIAQSSPPPTSDEDEESEVDPVDTVDLARQGIWRCGNLQLERDIDPAVHPEDWEAVAVADQTCNVPELSALSIAGGRPHRRADLSAMLPGFQTLPLHRRLETDGRNLLLALLAVAGRAEMEARQQAENLPLAATEADVLGALALPLVLVSGGPLLSDAFSASLLVTGSAAKQLTAAEAVCACAGSTTLVVLRLREHDDRLSFVPILSDVSRPLDRPMFASELSLVAPRRPQKRARAPRRGTERTAELCAELCAVRERLLRE